MVDISAVDLARARAHRAAVAGQAPFYDDPRTGFAVKTAVHHLARGFCCGNACRHCPYDWTNVDADRFDGLEAARARRRELAAAMAARLDAEG